MSTPHVAGVAALMLSLSPSMTPQQVRTVLHGTAVDRGPAGYDLEYGYGRLNAAAAVTGSVDATLDTDQDGCLGAQELGPDEGSGGRRDPDSFWDFFDTPDPTNTRDKAIAGTDFFRVIGRFGSTGSTGIDPLSQPPAPPAYHTAFDRGPSAGPNSWNLTPADGAVSGTDFFAIISQFTHSCLA
jgi:hypothetical protein